MEYLKLTSLIVIISIFISGCSTKCENISNHEAIFLLDVSDHDLYKSIRKDIESNFPNFVNQIGMAKVSTCERNTYRIAPMGAQNALKLSSAHIEIAERGLSYDKAKQEANPEPLVNLVIRKLKEYSGLSQSVEVTSGSNIANIILKTINSSDINAEHSTIIIFSDFIENTSYVDMYREIPSGAAMEDITHKLFDPIVLDKFKEKRKEGLSPNVVLVSKPSGNSTVDLRKVRSFWKKIFEEKLGLHRVQFIDNLAQYDMER